MAARIERHPEAFALSTHKKRPRKEDGAHLKWIRTLPCLVTGLRKHVEAAHIRYDSLQHGKPATPLGRKPDDRWAVPLSAEKHRLADDAQHNSNEREWWERHGIDPITTAALLFAVSGDDEAAEQIIRNARARTP